MRAYDLVAPCWHKEALCTDADNHMMCTSLHGNIMRMRQCKPIFLSLCVVPGHLENVPLCIQLVRCGTTGRLCC